MTDDYSDTMAAVSAVGRDARPTGRLRMLQVRGVAGRIQQEWRGDLGVVWLDIPMISVERLPERSPYNAEEPSP